MSRVRRQAIGRMLRTRISGIADVVLRLTNARKELPWAVTRTVCPASRSRNVASYQ